MSSSRSLGHAEIRRGLAVDVVVVRVERDVGRRRARERLEHLRRAAGRVLVQVQPQPVAGRRGPVIRVWLTAPSQRSTARARVSPSASASARTVGARRAQAGLRHALHRDDADEVGGVQPAAEPGGAAGRQHVIRTDRVVASHLRGVLADEDGAGACRLPRPSSRRRRRGARGPCGWPARWRPRAMRVTMMPPCDASESGAGPLAGICASTSRAHCCCQPALPRDEDGARVGIVLGLRNEIGGEPRRAGRCPREPESRSVRPACRSRLRSRRSVFAAATYLLPGPDDAIDARDRTACRTRARQSPARRRAGTAVSRRQPPRRPARPARDAGRRR